MYLLLHVRHDLALEGLKGLKRLLLVLVSKGHRLANNTSPLLKTAGSHWQVRCVSSCA